MKLEQKRKIAIRSARSQLSKMGCLDIEMTVQDAEAVLDDMARSEPDLIASQWWVNASDRQYNLFRGEWEKWLKEK